MATSSAVYNSWQKAHHLKDKLETFMESLKSRELKEEAEDAEVSVIYMKQLIEKLTTKLLTRKK